MAPAADFIEPTDTRTYDAVLLPIALKRGAYFGYAVATLNRDGGVTYRTGYVQVTNRRDAILLALIADLAEQSSTGGLARPEGYRILVGCSNAPLAKRLNRIGRDPFETLLIYESAPLMSAIGRLLRRGLRLHALSLNTQLSNHEVIQAAKQLAWAAIPTTEK